MPQIRNPQVSILRARLGDLLTLADAASQDVQAPNTQPLAGVTIDKSLIADLLAVRESAETGAEQALYDGIMARVVETATALAALPLMIDAP